MVSINLANYWPEGNTKQQLILFGLPGAFTPNLLLMKVKHLKKQDSMQHHTQKWQQKGSA